MEQELFKEARSLGVTDVHIDGRGDIWFRRVNVLRRHKSPGAEVAGRLLANICRLSQNDGEADFSFGDGYGRVRAHSYEASGANQLSLRFLPNQVPSVKELSLGSVGERILKERSGLVLVTGPTGSGKSTTLAALLQEMLYTKSIHVMTFESPIEYELTNGAGLVHQCEVAEKDLSSALQGALRADPDVLMIGEIRSAATLQSALLLAETGHLVLASMHTPTAVDAIGRAADLFPEADKSRGETMLSELLRLVIGQRLLPGVDDSGLVLAAETFVITPAARRHIRQNERHLLPQILESGTDQGMRTFDDALSTLFMEGRIDEATLFAFAQKPDRLRRRWL